MRVARVLAIGLLVVSVAGFGMRAVASPAHMPPAAVLRAWACAGKERWKIKTLIDDQAGDVNKTATTKTVEELRANTTRPEKVSSKAMRIHPVEFRRYRVHATIDAAFREGDGDLHVVIHDRANDGTTAEADTIIAESPDAILCAATSIQVCRGDGQGA